MKLLQTYIESVKKHFPQLRYSTFHRKIFFGNRPITNDDLFEIRLLVGSDLYCIPNKYDINAAVHQIAKQNSFNPVKEYLDSLEETNTNYIDTWLIDIAGVKDTIINRVIGRKWLMSAVARAVNPGCAAEGALILSGKQGAGKSRLFQEIVPGYEYYFGDNFDIDNSRQFALTTSGKWILEFSELSSLTKKTVESIKAFITRSTDVFEVKNEMFGEEKPRSCIFGGTTNRTDILVDPTGSRRFWCVEVADKIDIELLQKRRSILWAEAYREYKKCKAEPSNWILNAEERKLLDESNIQFEIEDPCFAALKDRLQLYAPEILNAGMSSADLLPVIKEVDNRASYPKLRSLMEGKLGWKYDRKNSKYFPPIMKEMN